VKAADTKKWGEEREEGRERRAWMIDAPRLWKPRGNEGGDDDRIILSITW